MSYHDNYDQCKRCSEEYKNKYDAKYEWCKSCQISNLKNNLTNWTSDNEKIDNLIQEMQLEINELDDLIFEWIPYGQFNNIKKMGNKVYSAIWKDGPLNYDICENEYTRNPNKKVALKLYYSLQHIISEFFIDQNKKYSLTYIGEVLRMYGISQYPITKDYIIVFQDIYCKKCGKKYTNIVKEWCKSCQINYFKNNSASSGNEKIDSLIKEIQLQVNYGSEIVFEWILYDQLNDVQEIGKDNDFDTMLYSAIWEDGPLCYNDGEWTRKSNKVITLKYLYDSQNIIKFINRIRETHLKFRNCQIYGISQNPYTEDYIMIFPNIYCKKCNEKYRNRFDANGEWCKSCQISNLKQNFTNWTSGNEKIDNLIQEMQLEIINRWEKIFEWIPYNQFNNIKEKTSTKEYFAIWKDGPLNYNKLKNLYTRNNQNIKVTLKLHNFQNITNEFLNELKEDLNKYHGKIFGISQNPYTKDYIIILQNGYNEICKKCEEPTMFYTWCRLCHINYLKNFFINWSKNEKIDNLIKEEQLKIDHFEDNILEFIPYSQFNDIKEISKKSFTWKDQQLFTTVYSSIWKDGPLLYHNDVKKWTRESNKKVYLKLYSLQNTDAFLNEVKKYLSNNDNSIYGISHNQNMKSYIIVLEYKLYCEKCDEEYKVEGCKKCQLDDLKLMFANWTSKDNKIDNLIQKVQLNIYNNWNIVLEWIPYNQFNDIKEINDGFSIKMYSAIWKNDFLYYDNLYEKEQVRRLKSRVTLEYLQNIDNEVGKFLRYIRYGITQDPYTKEYIIVFENEYCERCDNKYADAYFKWCKSCQINDLKMNFTNWSSGNTKIDNLIQEMQLKINEPNDIIFEWIPFSQFRYIKEIGKGGFATVYSAIWKGSPLSYNNYDYEYVRDNMRKVALKQLNNSQNITIKFLNEISEYSINTQNNILTVYGISQNPNTKNYIMVLDYAEGGNLYNWVNRHYCKIDWPYNIKALFNIIEGLNEIHQNNMVHRDFHTGNILSITSNISSNSYISIRISDMGLCGKADNTNEENIYGVMPYVAPEVLRGGPYTQAADIYSFGMIMYFVATGRQPFSNSAYDENLALDICEGIRPEVNELEVPKCYIDLMKKCWDSNPENRPKSTEILELVRLFHELHVPNSVWSIGKKKSQQHYDIEKQFKKADEYKESNFLFLDERRQLTTHPQAVYTSQLLNSYTKDLPKYSECLDCEI